MTALWTTDDLWVGIPTEYQGALLPDSLRDVLKRGPLSVALIGPAGVGKTRNLWAMVHHARRAVMVNEIGTERRDPLAQGLKDRDRVKIITEVGDIRAHRYDRGWLDQQCAWPHWLAVDDIGCIEPNEWVREALYHLANERRAHGRRTVWTSNLTADGLRSTFGGAIASRILGGLVIECGGNDRRLET
jgi:DNA replication protein DnaC